MNFKEWLEKELNSHNSSYFSKGDLAEAAWNAALELAETQVNQIVGDHNTIVCAVDVINRIRTDKVNE